MGIALQICFIEREWGLGPRGNATGKFIESICVIYASYITRIHASYITRIDKTFKPS